MFKQASSIVACVGCAAMVALASGSPQVIRLPSGLPDGTDATVFRLAAINDAGSVVVGTTAGVSSTMARRWVVSGSNATVESAAVTGSATSGVHVSADGLWMVGSSRNCQLPNVCEEIAFVCNPASQCGLLTPITQGNSIVNAISGDALTMVGTDRAQNGVRWIRPSVSSSFQLAGLAIPTGTPAYRGFPVDVNRTGSVAVGDVYRFGSNGAPERSASRWQVTPGSGNSGTWMALIPGSTSSWASAVDATGNVIAGIANGEPFVWTPGTGARILPYTGNTTPVQVADMSEDSRVIAGVVLAQPVVWMRLQGSTGYQMFRVEDLLADAGIFIADATLTGVGGLNAGGSCLLIHGTIGSARAGWVIQYPCSLADGPVLLQQPMNTHVCGSGPLNLAISASGQGLTYRWSLDGQVLVDGPRADGSRIEGAFTHQLRIVAPGAQSVGMYRCRVEGACGEVFTRQIDVTVCRVDFNCDAAVDFFDYLDFVDLFAGQSPLADYSGDGTVDLFDYLDFVQDFATGC